MPTPSRAHRLFLSIAYVIFIIAGLSFAIGPPGLAVGIICSILFVAWRHDNAVGFFLPLAALFIITVLVLFLLIYLLVITHP